MKNVETFSSLIALNRAALSTWKQCADNMTVGSVPHCADEHRASGSCTLWHSRTITSS